MNAQIEEAKSLGYTDDEINDFLVKKQAALHEGYSPEEISAYLGQKQNSVPEFEEPQEPENPNLLNEFSRKAAVGLSGALNALPQTLAYDIGASIYNASQQPKQNKMENLFFLPQEEKEPQFPTQTPGMGVLKDVPLEIEQEAPAEQPFQLPLFQDVLEQVGKDYLGIDLKPKDLPEKILHLAAFLKKAGSKALFEKTVNLGKDIRRYEVGKQLFYDAGLATAAVGMHEAFGTPEFATILTSGLFIPTLAKVGRYAKNEVIPKGAEIFRKMSLIDPRNLSLKNPIESFKREAARQKDEAKLLLEEGGMSAERYEALEPYLKIAEEFGIPINVGSFTDSAYFKDMEKLLSTNPMSQEAKNEFLQNAAKKWADAQYQLTRQMSAQSLFSDKNSVAQALFDEVTSKKFSEMKDQYTALYDAASEALKDSPPLTADQVRQLENALTQVYEKVGSSLLPTSAEESTKSLTQKARSNLFVSPTEAGRPVLEGLEFATGKELERVELEQAGKELKAKQGRTALMRAEAKAKQASLRRLETEKESQKKLKKLFGDEAKNMRIDENGKIQFLKPINGKNLSDTIRSLNSFIEWDHPETRNLMKGFLNQTKTVLGRVYGNSVPEGYKALLEANKVFGESQKLFGDAGKWKKWKLNADSTPEDLLGTLKTVSDWNRLEHDFGRSQRGKLLIDELKRLKVEEKLAPYFQQIEYKPGYIAEGINRLKRDPIFLRMLDKETKKNLNLLAGLDAQMQRGTGRQFFKYQENYTSDELKYLLSPKQWVLRFGQKLNKEQMAKAYATIMLNPNITSEMVRIGEEAVKLKNRPTKEGFIKLNAEAQDLFNAVEQTAKQSAKVAAIKAGQKSVEEELINPFEGL